MGEEHKFISPSTDEDEIWHSPMNVFSDQTKNDKGLLMSTPNLSTWMSLTTSEGDGGSSSQQDSGYCSFTPSSSVTPFRDVLHTEKCQWCGNVSRENYELSPLYSYCNCKQKYRPKCLSSNLEYLQTISETKSIASDLFLSQGSHNVGCDLLDEAMDTSLYPDELELENNQSEAQGCLVAQMEMDEERSIDFVDSGLHISNTKPSDNKRPNEEESIHEQFEVGCNSQLPMLGCDTTTPNMRNYDTLSKKRKDTNFLSIAKKIATVSRVMKSFSINGIEKIDMLYQLTNARWNCPHIVSQIFSYLSERDLDSVAMVSKTWHELVCNDFTSYNRWKLYKTTMTMRKENFTSPTKDCAVDWVSRSSPLSPLQCIQNVLPQRSGSLNNHQRSPPVSPQSARFRSFQKAAKTLKKGERLLPCPKCFFPSHDRGSPTLQCSRSGCRHRFCVWCRNEIVTGVSHNCPPRYTPKSQSNSNYKIAMVGSKSCKRKLRRLVLD